MADHDSSATGASPGVILECGWGRLLFAHTFPDPGSVAEAILREEPDHRDIAFYLTDPHIVLNHAPQQLFLDPSHTYRIRFERYAPRSATAAGFSIGPVERREDIAEINRIYGLHKMVTVDEKVVWASREDERLDYVVARSDETGSVLGVALGVDHMANFQDLENGSSLWSLAVDPQAPVPGIGQGLVRWLIEHYQRRGRSQLDLSVMHTNKSAIALYEKLGFERVAVFAVKTRNSYNEPLYVGEFPDSGYNPYAKIIIDEALRRGIAVDPLDPPRGYFRLRLGGRRVTCRESLSELTSAVALSRCDDKAITRDLLIEAGLRVPDQVVVKSPAEAESFLGKHHRIVVKPARGEQGQGISVDVRRQDELEAALAAAGRICETVLLEEFVQGEDLRIIVINGESVAAAVRRPPEICGTGRHTIRQLIESLSRRREAATGGESHIPIDAETERCVRNEGFSLDDTIEEGRLLAVRKTANLHTGGTIHDVTSRLHPKLAAAAVRAAQCLEIPVVGFDLIVPSIEGPDYAFIEANERPGLANHEPAPTAQKFIDFLFPHTAESTRGEPARS
ncbi:MAG: N-acetylglutaminylglutamine synthetase [Puniceicoccaceae bacterium]|nr:MAG: N-acetylglutaminylglutamine synthetase [Puniceicoccaceae bacterium]